MTMNERVVEDVIESKPEQAAEVFANDGSQVTTDTLAKEAQQVTTEEGRAAAEVNNEAVKEAIEQDPASVEAGLKQLESEAAEHDIEEVPPKPDQHITEAQAKEAGMGNDELDVLKDLGFVKVKASKEEMQALNDWLDKQQELDAALMQAGGESEVGTGQELVGTTLDSAVDNATEEELQMLDQVLEGGADNEEEAAESRESRIDSIKARLRKLLGVKAAASSYNYGGAIPSSAVVSKLTVMPTTTAPVHTTSNSYPTNGGLGSGLGSSSSTVARLRGDVAKHVARAGVSLGGGSGVRPLVAVGEAEAEARANNNAAAANRSSNLMTNLMKARNNPNGHAAWKLQDSTPVLEGGEAQTEGAETDLTAVQVAKLQQLLKEGPVETANGSTYALDSNNKPTRDDKTIEEDTEQLAEALNDILTNKLSNNKELNK